MRYRKKPVVIDAIQWTGVNIEEALAFMSPIDELPNNSGHVRPGVGYTPPSGELTIPTLEGDMLARPGDWIIKGIKGEFYPCRADIFEATYEKEIAHEQQPKTAACS